jgi:hypothetical protein
MPSYAILHPNTILRLKSHCTEFPGIEIFSLKGARLKDIAYANDIALMAHSLAKLQLLIDCLKRFCEEVGMEVNVDNTKGMIFSRHRAGPRVCLTALI